MTKAKKGKAVKTNISAEIRGVGVLVEAVAHEVHLIGEQYGDINRKLDSVVEDVAIIKQDVGFMKLDLKLKVDIEQFSALERRVALLEKKSHKA